MSIYTTTTTTAGARTTTQFKASLKYNVYRNSQSVS